MAAKRASYRAGVDWIALNDDPTIMDAEVVASLISVCLLADLFEKSQEDVARDVIRQRKKFGGAR
jgi:hypothetical protein